MSPKDGRQGSSSHPPRVKGALEALVPILPCCVVSQGFLENSPQSTGLGRLCDSELPPQLWLKSLGQQKDSPQGTSLVSRLR